MKRPARFREAFILAASGALSIALLFALFARGDLDWHRPLAYTGDALSSAAWAQALIDGDWWPFTALQSSRLAAPQGLVLGDFPIPEQLQTALLGLIARFTTDPFVAINVFYVASFALVGMAMTWLLRRFRISPALAVLGGLFYTLLPYHFLRYAHLHLSAYYAVPIACHIILSFHSGAPPFFIADAAGRLRFSFFDRRGLAFAAFALCSTFFGFYYAFFFALLLCAAACFRAARARALAPLASAALLCSCAALSVAISVAPTLIYQYRNGPNTIVAARFPHEAELYGLKLTNLLLPSGTSRFALLDTAKKRYESATPLYEGTDEGLGLLGAATLVALVLAVLFRLGPDEGIHRFLGMLCLVSILYATIGGLASIFSSLVSPVIRSTNRISVYIACFVFLALCQWADRALQRIGSRFLRALALAFVAGLGLLELVPASARIDKSFHAELDSDRKFFQAAEAALPKGASVLQLPFVCYPECRPLLQLGNQMHLKGFIHTRRLRWSFGAPAGRPEAARIWRLSQAPLDAAAIRAAGYSAVYLDRRGFADQGREAERQLTPWVDKALSSDDGKLLLLGLK